MSERRPPAALAGLVSRITGYRETQPGHFRQVEAASLDIPLIISFGEPFAIGLGPKSVSRIVRLNRAIAAAKAGDGWAGIAADCGYADQAHMVREFRELAGNSPVAWASAG